MCMCSGIGDPEKSCECHHLARGFPADLFVRQTSETGRGWRESTSLRRMREGSQRAAARERGKAVLLVDLFCFATFLFYVIVGLCLFDLFGPRLKFYLVDVFVVGSGCVLKAARSGRLLLLSPVLSVLRCPYFNPYYMVFQTSFNVSLRPAHQRAGGAQVQHATL